MVRPIGMMSDEEINRRKDALLEHYSECGHFSVSECERHGKAKRKHVESTRGPGTPL